MKNKLIGIVMLALCGAVHADDGWTVLDRNYTLKANDEKCTSGSYEVGNELQPEGEVVVDGSNWRVGYIVAFQQSGYSLTLKSGSIVINSRDHNGCYPNNGNSYINFSSDSTAKVTMPFAVGEVYSSCFSQGNFRVDGNKLSEAEFGLKIACMAVDAGHTLISLREPKPTDIAMTAVSLAVVEPGVVDASVTFAEDGKGDGNAQLYAVWDLSDRGLQLSAWPNQVSVGTVGQFTGTKRLSGLPELTRVSVRFIAVVSDEESFSSPCATIFSLYLEREDVPWPGNKDTDVSYSGHSYGFDMSSDRDVKHLELVDGSYVFPGKKTLYVYDGMTVNDSFVQFHGRVFNMADNAVFAFTNAYVQYLGTTNDNGDPNPFSTGGGQYSPNDRRSGVRIEMVNTTDHAKGMFWDAMQDGIKIGDWASDCSLLVDGGGVTAGAVVTNMYYNKRGLHVGEGDGGCNNTAVLRGGAELWDDITVNNARNDVGYGNGANYNRLEILGGEGFVTMLYKCYPGAIGRDACTGNVVVVDGKGFAGSAVWKCRKESLDVGRDGAVGSELWIKDGGLVDGPTLNVGNNACLNTLYVIGDGSVLRGGGGETSLTVGRGDGSDDNPARSVGNRLIIADGGMVEKFSKWKTVIGGHEDGRMRGESKDNGVEVRSGGKFYIPNDFFIGRMMKSGSRSDGNYLLVTGSGSVADTTGNQSTYIAQVQSDGGGDTGATASGNELRVEDNGYFHSRNIWLTRDSSATAPGAANGNRILATTGGHIYAVEELGTGLEADKSRAAEEAVAINNEIIAENGGIIEAKKFVTYSGNGNTITVRNGGVLQVFERDPVFKPFEEGGIVLENGVLSYRVNVFDVNNIMNSTKEDGIRNLTVRGYNALRMNDCANTDWESQAYEFAKTDEPRHFCRLEMVDGTTRYCGDPNKTDDVLAIAASGSMLCSNTTATVAMTLSLSGPLDVVNSSLTLEKASTLAAPVTLVDATLDLPAGTNLGDGFALTIGGELEDGRAVITSAEDLEITATMPENWRLKKRKTDTGFVYFEHHSSGLLVIFR